jgi:hypothetical protein
MARSTHDYEINGVRYRTTALPAKQALDVLPRLLVLLGADLLKLILADDSTIDKAIADEDLRVGLLLHVAEKAQAGELTVLADLFTDTAILAADGSWQPLDFDEHFAGDLGTLFSATVQAAIGSFTRPLPVGSPSPSTPNTPA